MQLSAWSRWCPVRGLTAVLIFVSLFSSSLAAQNNYLEQLGPPPMGAIVPVELGYINLTNGNLHLEVPLGGFRQRGKLPYTAKLVYDSRIWVPMLASATSSQITFRPFNLLAVHPSAGWRLEITNDPNFHANYIADSELCDSQIYPDNPSWAKYSNFDWQEPNGTMHTWSNQNMYTAQMFVDQVSNCSPYGNVPSTSGYADDGSGFFMVVSNYTQMTIYAPDGRQIVTDAEQTSGTPKDLNGNYFSLDSNANVIDTLGRTPVLMTTVGNQIFYDVLNGQGGRSRYTVTTENISASVPYYTTTLTVYQKIDLPNGTSYQFGYDAGASGNNWGLINSVTLPTGGQVSYGYTTFSDATGSPLEGTNRWVSSRTSGGGTWTYTPQVVSLMSGTCGGVHSPPVQQNTVTRPDGSYAVYKSKGVTATTASQFVNIETDNYAADGTLLKQETFDYNDPSCLPLPMTTPSLGANIPTLSRISTAVRDSGGNVLTRKREFDYANSPSVYQPTKVSEWNYYQGTAPSTPDRFVQAAYSNTNSIYAGAHITGLPLTVTLSQGSSQIAQTSYSYDSTALVSTGTCQSSSASQPSPAAPQHDYQAFCTSNTVRGNPTQIKKWLNTSNSLITTATNTYDDTGNLITTADALNSITAFEYSPVFGRAYETKETNALLQVTTKNYDFNSGLLVSVTDPNGQITGLKTTYSYDNMGRLIETDFPDGGQTNISFNGDTVPLTVTTTRLATPDPSIITNTVFDGLGRKASECIDDPEANYLGFFPCSSAFPEVYGKSGKLLSFLSVILSSAPLNSAG